MYTRFKAYGLSNVEGLYQTFSIFTRCPVLLAYFVKHAGLMTKYIILRVYFSNYLRECINVWVHIITWCQKRCQNNDFVYKSLIQCVLSSSLNKPAVSCNSLRHSLSFFSFLVFNIMDGYFSFGSEVNGQEMYNQWNFNNILSWQLIFLNEMVLTMEYHPQTTGTCLFIHLPSRQLKDRCHTWSPKTAVFYILFNTRPSSKNMRGVFFFTKGPERSP